MESPRAFRANFAGDGHSRWYPTPLTYGKKRRQVVNKIATGKEGRATEEFLGMEGADEWNRGGRFLEGLPHEIRQLGRICKVPLRSGTNSVIEASRPTERKRPIGHLQQTEGITAWPLIEGTAGMVRLLGCIEPVVNPQREVRARDFPREGCTWYSCKVDFYPQAVEDPHGHVVMIHPSRFRAANLEVPRQGSMAVQEALPHPVDIVLFLIPNVVPLGKAPSMGMPTDFVSLGNPLPPEFSELVREERGISHQRSHLVDPAFLADKRSEEHTSELQSPCNIVCRLLLEKKKTQSTS